ncbi:S1-like domain-containing RNA-binding protein [Belliella sp. DSM 107340]|uniref:S1-like domain-containing RNA-binding protein n=1 Tax=Belliella calami TaxID=2923436 RepID=A0ABS9USU4_9BACT|nr:S1-like domain-containing RNA-binding protein [Belliella calami]MCH7399504.1 S1-like domain-containing RNA-binding protein [Belliella calami]
MKELGKINSLLINRFTANGAYLALHDGEEVLLPKSYLQEDFKEGQEVEVFVYTDSEDRPVAVTNRPVALLDEFAVMEAKEITRFGAFMDWGLPKDLFVPKSEMHVEMEEGEKYLVRVCMDFKTDRLIGVSKYEDFLELETRGFEEGQEVEALIFAETDLGFKALIENAFEGLIYKNEVFTSIELGDKVRAFVKKRREDGKLDLRLEPVGREKYEEGAEKILSVLKVKKFLPLHDKSSPESIKELLGMSKKHFKQSIGQLYKAKIIKILDNGIELV